MQPIRYIRYLLFITTCAFVTLPVLAQSTNSTAATPPASKPAATAAPKPARPAPLTKDQRAEVAKAKAAALKANPDLVSEQKDLDAQKKELAQKQADYQTKLNAAMVKADPSVASLLPPVPVVK